MSEAEKYVKKSVCGYCEIHPDKCDRKCLAAKYAEKGYIAGKNAAKEEKKAC